MSELGRRVILLNLLFQPVLYLPKRYSHFCHVHLPKQHAGRGRLQAAAKTRLRRRKCENRRQHRTFFVRKSLLLNSHNFGHTRHPTGANRYVHFDLFWLTFSRGALSVFTEIPGLVEESLAFPIPITLR